MGFARLAENGIRKVRGKKEGDALGALDKIAASTVGGALATWNQPIEVVRVEVSEDPVFSVSRVLNRFVRCNPWLRLLLPTPTDLPS